ncbi:MAG: Ig-like domain-containing protein [Clostridia bacterium]|nr:Ig-like domain-containing protein [Clostridia bacterium]
MRRIIRFLCLVVIAVLTTVLIMNNNAKADGENLTATWDGGVSIPRGNASSYTITFNKTITRFNKYTISQSGTGKVSFQPYSVQDSFEMIYNDQTLNQISFTCWGTENGSVTLSINFEGEIALDGGGILEDHDFSTYSITVGQVEQPAQIKTEDGNTSAQLNVGDSIQLTSDKDVSGWTSDTPAVVSVSDGGLISALGVGSAKIYAYSENVKSQDFNVTVVETPPDPQPPADSKTPVLTPTSIELKVGENGKIQVSNSDEVAVSWSNSNTLVANFTEHNDSECNFLAVSAGTTTITAASKADPSKTASVNVTVNPKQEADTEPPVISPNSNVKISVGSQKTLSADKGVVWKSSDSSVVSVGEQSGIIKGVSQGKATITAIALSNNKTASIEVTVEPKSSDGSDSADPVITPSEAQSIKVGETVKLSADKSVTWSTGNKSVATVDSEGNVKGVGAGTTEISATTSDGRFSTVKVTVSGSKSSGGTSTNTTGNVIVDGGNSSSTVNEAVPKTGEASTTTLIVIGAITLVIATVIFRRKAK